MICPNLVPVFFLWAFTTSSAAAEPPRDLAVGDWSQAVADTRGYALRGRLVLAETRVAAGRRQVAVYIELQDASEAIGGGMRVFCDLGKTDFSGKSKTGLTCELHDSNKQPVPPMGFPFGGGVPKSEWIHLPADATIRLRASPFGIHRPDAMAISPQLNTLWVIPDGDPAEYSLVGTFVVDPEEGRNTIQDPQIWRGTLELPAVRIRARP